jgi:hypothetical protein
VNELEHIYKQFNKPVRISGNDTPPKKDEEDELDALYGDEDDNLEEKLPTYVKAENGGATRIEFPGLADEMAKLNKLYPMPEIDSHASSASQISSAAILKKAASKEADKA